MLALVTILALSASAFLPTTVSLPTVPLRDAAAPCTGAPPPPGAVLRGPVLHVLDGVTLCVALGTTPDKWVPLELAAARRGAPARGTLMAVAFSRNVTCQVIDTSGATSIADCRLNDRPLTELIVDPGAIRAGLSWRR